jgi:hypothetical protein
VEDRLVAFGVVASAELECPDGTVAIEVTQSK